ncbi:hypothetical protein [Mucilaginibacter paludis]|uniref:Right-handed parallel beta-helix repeat-containing protein n=1 Tax=Mucilaginibacter paludis DSM 18603 TaxID=714943 RepID=H1YEV4_9SPHI|nr:hypothetical protein [Mucilaginibacter paludis]EHQ24371.1 hypothetical protein Mucpa_0171 [Mucilaginibacter paludis DSM 18603]
MKKTLYIVISLLLSASVFYSCKKNADFRNLSAAIVPIASPISNKGCLVPDQGATSASIKGTMLAGQTYNICANVLVNVNDTLIIQPGVKINFTGNYGIGVHGTLISLGTKDAPVYFTHLGTVKTDNIGKNPATDSAYAGKWSGIFGAADCKKIILKWTHIEFAGAATSGDIKVISSSPYPLYFQNPYGMVVLEDSWIYGSFDDAVRTLGGKLEFFRNTFEKCGYTGGEALNAKAGTIGDFAYNVCIGIATNGPKNSNISAIPGVPGSNIRMYNNTIVNCGYRRSAAGRGGSINFEQGAAGMAYNNIMVNCKFGLRIVQNPIADTANIRYGYNYTYADSLTVANQIYPSIAVSNAFTNSMPTDIPSPSAFLPNGWTPGMVYTANPAILGANNPQFINGPVPMPVGAKLSDITTVSTYNFNLKLTSPCVGKGFTNFMPYGLEKSTVPVDPNYGVTEYTLPGRDIGAYQTNGKGNQHF